MRFVVPELVKIDLPGGDWIEVKKELTVGEEKRYRTAALRRTYNVGKGDEELQIDWGLMAFARVEAYVVNWSASQPFSRSALEALASEDFEAIDDAVQAHIAARTEEKKARSTTPTLITSVA